MNHTKILTFTKETKFTNETILDIELEKYEKLGWEVENVIVNTTNPTDRDSLGGFVITTVILKKNET